MLETLLGGLLGGAFRIVPEVLKFFDRENERKHELLMQDKQLEFEKLRGDNKLAIAQETTYGMGIEALTAALEGQGKSSGITYIDALSSSVRPIVTYLFVGLFIAVKWAAVSAMVDGGYSYITAIATTWTEADMALLAGIINFWFLGRVFERGTSNAK